MSANNVVWCMLYKEYYHVFYSGCMDNTPTEPDYKNRHHKAFKYRSQALLYAHDVLNQIDEEAGKGWGRCVEYGVCEITVEEKTIKDVLKDIIKIQKKILFLIGDHTEPNKYKALGTRQGKIFALTSICDKMLEDV